MSFNHTPSSDSNTLAIQAKGLGKGFTLQRNTSQLLRHLLLRTPLENQGTFWAVKDLDLHVLRGEVVGVVGRNGAGKSTLLQMICGTLAPSEGQLHVNGRVAALLELGAGFNPEFTGIENVLFQGALMRLSQAQMRQLLPEILAFADIGAFAEQPVKTYSSGMFVRLAFAVATSVEPDILVIDEALSVGDGAFARKSFERIKQLKDAGKTILFCSHSMYQVEALCTRAIWLEKGRVRMQGPASEVTSAYSSSLEDALLESSSASVPPTNLPLAPQGSGRIVRASLICDRQSGQHVQVRSCQSDLTVRVEYAIDPALPSPGIALGIADAQGRTVASVTSVHDGFVTHTRSDGQGWASVTFRRLPLLKGNYSITVFLSTEDALHAYDQAEHSLRFYVVQDSVEQGLVSLPHDWSQ